MISRFVGLFPVYLHICLPRTIVYYLFKHTSCCNGAVLMVFLLQMSTTEAEIATSLLVLGAWIGCLLGNKPSGLYGRRLTTLWNNVFFIAGAILCCVSNKWVLFLGRFICGIGVGVESVVVPVLLSEMASPAHRGTITTLHQLLITFGIFVAGILGYAFVTYVSSGWVVVQAVIALPAVAMLLGMSIIPESPKWLLAQGRGEEAAATMKLLRPSGYDVDGEIAGIQEEIDDSPKEDASWAEVFACKRSVVIGCGLMFFTAITGINSVIFYSSTIFGFAGFDNAIAATVAVGAINFIATGMATYLVDVYGRRQLLWVGTNIMIVSLAMLAAVLLGANDAGSIQGVLAVIAVLSYVIGFAVGLGAVSWVVLSEIMSTHLRSKAFGLFVSINWGCNLVIGLTTLTGMQHGQTLNRYIKYINSLTKLVLINYVYFP
jgi:SP family galactose:H+ symporter-like MFS transporter